MHQRFDQCPLFSPLLKFGNLFWGQFFLSAKVYAALFSLLNPIHLPLGPDFCFKLPNRAEHVKQQATRGIAGINVLIEHLEIDLFAFKFVGDLTQMQGRTRQPIQTSNNNGITFPHIL